MIKQRFHRFAIKHDYIKLFVIFYVSASAIIAIFLGMFYFLIWILLHIFLEIYKRYHLFRKLTLEDILIAFQHCRVDIMFLFLGISVEMLTNFSFSVTAGKLLNLAKAEKSSYIVLEESNILRIFRILPRVLGTAKASKSVAKVTEELFSHKKYIEKRELKIDKWDIIILTISISSIAIAFVYPILHGASFNEVFHSFLEVLSP